MNTPIINVCNRVSADEMKAISDRGVFDASRTLEDIYSQIKYSAPRGENTINIWDVYYKNNNRSSDLQHKTYKWALVDVYDKPIIINDLKNQGFQVYDDLKTGRLRICW